MADVRIRKCRVEVVRRGGWSWGADCDRLVRSVLDALERLLSELTDDLPEPQREIRISEPVRITVPLNRLAGFASGTAAQILASVGSGATAAEWKALIKSQLAESLTTRVEAAAVSEAQGRESRSEIVVPAGEPDVSPLEDALAFWERAGMLAFLLDRLPEPVLARVHAAVLRRAQLPQPSAPAATLGAISRMVEALLEDRDIAILTGPALLRMELTVAAQLGLRHLQCSAFEPRLWQAILRRTRLHKSTVTPEPTGTLQPSKPPTDPLPTGEQPARVKSAVAARPFRPLTSPSTFEVRSALPFLLLGPLAHTGYLKALAAGFEMHDRLADLPLWAAAFAFKSLDPPQRGWLRDETLPSAAVFAGLAPSLDQTALTVFAESITSELDLADAALESALLRAHTPAVPFCAAPIDGLWLLLDTEGLTPVSIKAARQDLLETVRGHLLVDADHDAVTELWDQLSRHRPAAPLAKNRRLETSVTIAAGSAMATIGWTLWKHRESVHPLLTLDRLSDLSALVSYEQSRVLVRLPLGARYLDLARHRLLEPINGIPWLPGSGRIEFARG